MNHKCYIMTELTFLKELMLIIHTSKSSNFDICHYSYFLEKEFMFQPHLCNWCYELMMSMNLSDIAILIIHVAYYPCIISGIS